MIENCDVWLKLIVDLDFNKFFLAKSNKDNTIIWNMHSSWLNVWAGFAFDTSEANIASKKQTYNWETFIPFLKLHKDAKKSSYITKNSEDKKPRKNGESWNIKN